MSPPLSSYQPDDSFGATIQLSGSGHIDNTSIHMDDSPHTHQPASVENGTLREITKLLWIGSDQLPAEESTGSSAPQSVYIGLSYGGASQFVNVECPVQGSNDAGSWLVSSRVVGSHSTGIRQLQPPCLMIHMRPLRICLATSSPTVCIEGVEHAFEEGGVVGDGMSLQTHEEVVGDCASFIRKSPVFYTQQLCQVLGIDNDSSQGGPRFKALLRAINAQTTCNWKMYTVEQQIYRFRMTARDSARSQVPHSASILSDFSGHVKLDGPGSSMEISYRRPNVLSASLSLCDTATTSPQSNGSGALHAHQCMEEQRWIVSAWTVRNGTESSTPRMTIRITDRQRNLTSSFSRAVGLSREGLAKPIPDNFRDFLTEDGKWYTRFANLELTDDESEALLDAIVKSNQGIYKTYDLRQRAYIEKYGRKEEREQHPKGDDEDGEAMQA
ncbi:hypothetical protein QFC22_003498 [Naganishia vaughanmartiniae]|uniref:Uncharacterized protein n=1 Tax=Naganishia vaughanmartiniae TaxID=1424756 RepID=A0ACC2X6M4_9TREE|nr:hypothetical protein QFC22_003498 [Naganishia vaughanmartiniae]